MPLVNTPTPRDRVRAGRRLDRQQAKTQHGQQRASFGRAMQNPAFRAVMTTAILLNPTETQNPKSSATAKNAEAAQRKQVLQQQPAESVAVNTAKSVMSFIGQAVDLMTRHPFLSVGIMLVVSATLSATGVNAAVVHPCDPYSGNPTDATAAQQMYSQQKATTNDALARYVHPSAATSLNGASTITDLDTWLASVSATRTDVKDAFLRHRCEESYNTTGSMDLLCCGVVPSGAGNYRFRNTTLAYADDRVRLMIDSTPQATAATAQVNAANSANLANNTLADTRAIQRDVNATRDNVTAIFAEMGRIKENADITLAIAQAALSLLFVLSGIALIAGLLKSSKLRNFFKETFVNWPVRIASFPFVYCCCSLDNAVRQRIWGKGVWPLEQSRIETMHEIVQNQVSSVASLEKMARVHNTDPVDA